jgi:hypothetical protein
VLQYLERRPRVGQSRHGDGDNLWSCPEHASEATPTEPCSPTPGRAFPANQPLTHVVTTEHVQQFLDILKSLGTQQGSPPKSPDSAKAAEGAKTDAREQPETTPASKLEFKTVNEVYVSNGAIKL